MKKFILSVLCFTFLFSAAFFVNGCQKKHEHSDVGNKPENNISFRTLSVGEKNIDGNIPVYGKVPNVQTKFSFIDEVTTTGNIQYIVSLDIYGIQQVATKTIPLTEGDNVVYVTEQLNGNPKAVYEVTIRRREIYTATVNPQGGSAVESQKIEEDSRNPKIIQTVYGVGYRFGLQK